MRFALVFLSVLDIWSGLPWSSLIYPPSQFPPSPSKSWVLAILAVILLLIVKTYYLSMMLKLYFWNTLRHTLTPSLSTQMVQSDAGVGYSVIFPSFCRGGSPLSVACVFTAGLSPIILALQIFFILPVSSFPIFCDSCSALFALEHFTCFVPPLILSVLEWIHLLQRRIYHIIFCERWWEWDGREGE